MSTKAPNRRLFDYCTVSRPGAIYSASRSPVGRPAINGLPIGGPRDLASPYLAPYEHLNDNPFKGAVADPNFPGFNPVAPHDLLLARLQR